MLNSNFGIPLAIKPYKINIVEQLRTVYEQHT